MNGELWDYWRLTFPWPLVDEMWDFVLDDIDDDCAIFVRSLTWRGPHSPL